MRCFREVRFLKGLASPYPLSAMERLCSRSRLTAEEEVPTGSVAECVTCWVSRHHSWTSLSSGNICVCFLVAQVGVSVKQALLRCLSSALDLPGIHSHLSFRKYCWLVHVNVNSSLYLQAD